MRLPSWHEDAIAKAHDRASFDCGDNDLNIFLRRYARQSHELGGAKTFLAVDDTDNKTILGFYSIAPGSMDHADTPELARRGLARHEVPGFRLARLATDIRVQGNGLGGQLLGAIGRRCIRVAAEVGGVMLIIDAKNERAAAWYASYGAITLHDKPLTLILPFATLERELRSAGQL
ncbi:GNAT family N-acetyltransferase [Rhizorhabdus wittichii DC-6]|jgi:GNAT superfamily N-acetyltransferase|uniref:GNAT family N-acetyltransferase n=1 Tax=Rhizorhabdus wittichii TaxID=160791 RepID=A0A975D4N9_9SPHN|nr:MULTISPECIES: hypothetical protein [Sphingomonadales]ARR56379.1 GNAT family N-acetyltransferase [Rhizorhabdus wittichii DC-6]EZP70549.1 Acetyltransferase [Sphingomonas paucimobilis]AMK24702.1 putative acetyltransferase [Sphingobium sp. TKS]AZI37448.1 GNAT family N-acetyltransferase [Caenibius tardaugens NBRC 16725]QTH22851.1 GNAT family N-acetyltransferase [Rhizorhabdus wittichii]